MVNPQWETGYTKIANEIMDALAKVRIPGETRQVLDAILRKTYGWNKKQDEISLSQFRKMTGLSSVHIVRARKKLLEMNLIIVTQKGNEKALIYRFQKNYDKWKALPKKVTLPKKVIGVTQKGNKALPKKGNTKDKYKETITKEKDIFPNWLPLEEFKEYKKMRIKIKKPMTDRAVELAISKLDQLKSEGHAPKEVLEQSILNSWQGLFPLKEEKKPILSKKERDWNETKRKILSKGNENDKQE